MFADLYLYNRSCPWAQARLLRREPGRICPPSSVAGLHLYSSADTALNTVQGLSSFAPLLRPDPFWAGPGIVFIPILGLMSLLRIVILSNCIVVGQSPALEPILLMKMTVQITHCPGGTNQRWDNISSHITTVSFEGLQQAVMLPALLNKREAGGKRATSRFVIHPFWLSDW